CQQGYRYPYTF
nr:immunoglobulin light chain junction region [Macaca mulatta]MOV80049.1 immunoglobulin light chain junction region [Macaca mulatta]